MRRIVHPFIAGCLLTVIAAGGRISYADDGTCFWREYRMPLWPIAAVTAVIPYVWLRNRTRIDARNRNGLCPACGYDLRATADRCPECGRANSAITG